MCSCEYEGQAGGDVSGGGGIAAGGEVGVGVKSIVTTVPVERVIAAGGDVCVAALASKSATRPAL